MVAGVLVAAIRRMVIRRVVSFTMAISYIPTEAYLRQTRTPPVYPPLLAQHRRLPPPARLTP
jgi:hypothetical protein